MISVKSIPKVSLDTTRPTKETENSKVADQLGFKHLEFLGCGTFGEVSLVKSKARGGQSIVMKRMWLKQGCYQNECDIHRALSVGKHANIIRMLASYETKDYGVIMMEYADQNDLSSHITKIMDMKKVHKFFKNMVTGIQFIHKHGYCHQDIKPQNLLISHGKLKICDFGLACRYQDENGPFKVPGGYGTRMTGAPENFKGGLVDGPPLDVWSMGIVLVDMICNQIPWEQAIRKNVLFNGYCTQPDWKSEEFDTIKEEDERILTLVKNMLQVDVSKRWTVEQIQNDDWYCNFVDKWPNHKALQTPKRKTYEEQFEEEAVATAKKPRNAQNAACKCCR
ncbi:hypothetical protein CRE_14309 [Caenorhabditis remanei]|uniref:Uncharacterized protein n=1 Tax=Caenorhabditis remanei TaxID=31234 RepID=E3NEY9_CAERE|nr:hypothetical protein CRE_14309 [Caenorhabditis remanei]